MEAAVAAAAVIQVNQAIQETMHLTVQMVKQALLIIPPTMVTLLIMIISQATLVQMVKLAKRDKLDKMVTQEMLLQ